MAEQYPKAVAKYNHLLYDDDNKDITFVFEDSSTVIKAHKILLEAVSPTFKTMFSGSFIEKNTATIRDILPEIFQKLINTIYLVPIEFASMEEAVQLYNVGEMYELDDLKDLSCKHMLNNCSWDNCLYVYDNARLFNLTGVLEKCQEIFKEFDYHTLISHLFRDTCISEETFIAVAQHWKGEHGELYQILEMYVETGKLKTYSKVIAIISFLSMTVDEIVSAKLLTTKERVAIIANIRADEQKYPSFIPMLDHLSKHMAPEAKPETRKFSQLIWIALLIACPTKEYTQLVLRKCLCFSAAFLGATETEACKQVFERKIQGERLKRTDLDLLCQVIRNRDVFFDKFFVNTTSDKKVVVEDHGHQCKLLEYEYDE